MIGRWAALGLCLVLGWTAAAAGESAVAIDGGKLQGTLTMPDAAGPVTAVLLIAGSGPTDRDGNSTVPGVKPANLKLIAEGLAKDGIASLRFDKRGIGASASAMTGEQDLRFSTYVDDAVAWAEYLKAQPAVRCVVVLGHSEGALIGALAAARTKVCGYISISGAGLPAGEILKRQFADHHAPEAAMQAVTAIIAKLEKGETVADTPPQFAALFRPSIQPYLISYFAVDPAKAVAAVPAPVLLLQGTTDVQVSLDDAQRLAKAKPDAKLVILEGVNHVLKSAPAEFKANVATYADPTLPLAPGVLPAIVTFVRALP
jgi:pimeloyl-ACP methyl ester carboxylesterase